MLPAPEAVHVPPVEPMHVHVAPTSDAGTLSLTVAPTASDGPAFVATMVYDTGVPGTAVATPSVLVIDRSARGVSVSRSVAVLLAGAGSVTPTGATTVPVLTSVPVAALEMATVT